MFSCSSNAKLATGTNGGGDGGDGGGGGSGGTGGGAAGQFTKPLKNDMRGAKCCDETGAHLPYISRGLFPPARVSHVS